jgi:hypothetical protein
MYSSQGCGARDKRKGLHSEEWVDGKGLNAGMGGLKKSSIYVRLVLAHNAAVAVPRGAGTLAYCTVQCNAARSAATAGRDAGHNRVALHILYCSKGLCVL